MTRGHSDWDMLYEHGFEPIQPPEGNPDDDLLFVSYARGGLPVLYKVHISDAEETLPGGQIVDTTMSGARYSLWRDGELVEIFDDAPDVLGLEAITRASSTAYVCRSYCRTGRSAVRQPCVGLWTRVDHLDGLPLPCL